MWKSGDLRRWEQWRTRYKSQRRYEETSTKAEMGSGMVARVTVRVLTPYVNLAIWSILQSKRIGFLWRWISSAGKLSLSISPLPATFLFFSYNSIIYLFILFLSADWISPHFLYFFWPPQPDPLWHFPKAHLSPQLKRRGVHCEFVIMGFSFFSSVFSFLLLHQAATWATRQSPKTSGDIAHIFQDSDQKETWFCFYALHHNFVLSVEYPEHNLLLVFVIKI